MTCSQYFRRVVIVPTEFQRYDVGYDEAVGAMHVATITNRRVDKSGQPREYVSHLLRRTYRDGSKVKHETLANLSPLPQARDRGGPGRAGQ